MGYHETITQAWLSLIAATVRNHGAPARADDFCDRHAHLLAPTLLCLFYWRELLGSAEAKTRFVEPDLAPLPK